MHLARKVATATLPLAAALAVLCIAPKAQAQSNIGSGVFSMSIDGDTVYNGENGDVTGPSVTSGTTLNGYVSVNGVSGNNGTTYINCYDNYAHMQIFSYSTQTNAQVPFSWKFSPSASQHQINCTAHYTGTYANATVSTPNIIVPVN